LDCFYLSDIFYINFRDFVLFQLISIIIDYGTK